MGVEMQMESAILLFIQHLDDCVASELKVIPLQVNHSTGEQQYR